MTDLEQFVRGYVRCMLWAENDDDDHPLDWKYGEDDIHPDSMTRIKADCEAFLSEMRPFITDENRVGRRDREEGTVFNYAGHDFWLTRNGHGCGFWDGDWSDGPDQLLTAASKVFGECYVYIGDDGMLHVS